MAENVALDILAIAAHPDDAEITCGGLLIKMLKKGRRTGVLDLTQGETGTFGDATSREREAADAARVLGLNYRDNLSLPDAALSVTQENKLKIAQIIRNTRPELVVLPGHVQRHPDHLACSQLGYDACFLAGLKKIDLSGEPFRPRKIIYASYSRSAEFSVLVDITEEFEQKCQAVTAYKSQFENPDNAKRIFQPGLDIFEYMRTRARYLGQMAGVMYAEAYSIKEHILIDDPQKMPVASI